MASEGQTMDRIDIAYVLIALMVGAIATTV
jgi:hypothetical protein